MARPKIAPENQKTACIMLRIPEADFEKINEICEATGMKKSEFVREVFYENLRKLPPRKTEIYLPDNIYEELKKMNTGVNQIGNNLNQIARKLNQGYSPDQELSAELNRFFLDFKELSEKINDFLCDDLKGDLNHGHS